MAETNATTPDQIRSWLAAAGLNPDDVLEIHITRASMTLPAPMMKVAVYARDPDDDRFEEHAAPPSQPADRRVVATDVRWVAIPPLV